MKVLLQDVDTYETMTIRQACLMNDIPVYRTSIDMLKHIFDFRVELLRGEILPVGSVEFVTQCLNTMGITPNLGMDMFYTYPKFLEHYLHRKVIANMAGIAMMSAEEPIFVKPTLVKQFNGFVFVPGQAIENYDEHDREQLNYLVNDGVSDVIYVSEVVQFVSEYRYYIDGDTILGSARYDPYGEDDAPEPDINVVREMVKLASLVFTNPQYALDVGVLSTGETALVECNDGWALGLYKGALTPKQYLDFLGKRWQGFVQNAIDKER